MYIQDDTNMQNLNTFFKHNILRTETTGTSLI